MVAVRPAHACDEMRRIVSPGTLRPHLAMGLPFHRGSGLPVPSALLRIPLAVKARPYVRVMVGCVEIRRALLLFAIVLGLAAIVTSLSNTRGGTDRRSSAPPPTTASSPTATTTPAPIRFDADRGPVTHAIDAGQSVTVMVSAEEPGTVELLGVASPVEPLTPARFDIYASRAGRHEVRLTSPATVRGRSIGVLIVRPAR